MKPPPNAASIQIDVVLCLGPRQTLQWRMALAEGSTLAQAQAAATAHGAQLLAQARPAADASAPALPHWRAWGVWGRAVAADYVLQEGDRLEAYRPLTVDPKTARRERFARQGARGAGLFAKRRAGAKPGY